MNTRSFSLVALVLTTGCSAAAQDPQGPAPATTTSGAPEAPVGQPSAPAPAPVGNPPPPDACASDRFVEAGRYVLDTKTANVWLATDGIGSASNFDAATVCTTQAPGFRPAKAGEVQDLVNSVPTSCMLASSCRLPRAFHAVFGWTNTGFFDASPRPVTTGDGTCVDLHDGSEPKTCAMKPDISRYTLCVR